MKKQKQATSSRDAKSGEYITKEQAARNPETTVTEARDPAGLLMWAVEDKDTGEIRCVDGDKRTVAKRRQMLFQPETYRIIRVRVRKVRTKETA